MEKLKISARQELDLKRYKEDYGLAQFVKSKDKLHYFFNELQDFTPQQFALLLCGWYEVETSYKEGDWISFDSVSGKEIGMVEGVDEVSVFTDIRGKIYHAKQRFYPKDLRYATPEEIAQEKERRKWAEIGRESGSYRKGDIVRFDNSLWEFSENGDQLVLIENGEGDEKDYKQAYAHEIELIVPVEQRFDKEES